VGSPDAESSAWYCTGQSTAAGQIDPGSVILTNTTTRSVAGSITGVTDSGARVSASVRVPPRGQVVADIPAPASGTWISDSVILSGGGVAVTQVVKGMSGWDEAPCQSSTSQDWYFPSASTAGSNGLFVALFNPTSTPDVVDLSFVTPAGLVHPINFQGLVLQPGQTQVQNVSSYIQNQSSVATSVMARTGRIVASELQLLSGTGSGMSIVPGAPRAERQWTIPQNLELAGGTSSIDVFNPGSTTEFVTVRARLDSGPLSPFTAHVLPDSTWIIPTSTETRIPQGDAYAAVVNATGGAGVVVGRSVGAPSSAQAPQASVAIGVGELSTMAPHHLWVVPSPGSTAMPAMTGVLPAHLALSNSTRIPERYVIYVMTPSGTRMVASGTLGPAAFIALGDSVLFAAGLNPLLISGSGPLAISEDVGPTGTLGVVTMPGIPLAGNLPR
jgi:uncharacterized protein DUF5719